MASSSSSSSSSHGPPHERKKSTEATIFVRFVGVGSPSSSSSSTITRHDLQNYFSSFGPIKKASIIRRPSKSKQSLEIDDNHNHNHYHSNNRGSYGFVKFVESNDAITAARTENGRVMMVNNVRYKLTVELATSSTSNTSFPSLRNETPTKKKKKQRNTTTITTMTSTDSSRTVEHDTSGSIVNNNEDNNKTSVDDVDDDGTTNQRRNNIKKRTNRCIIRNLSFYATENNIRSVLEKEFGPICELTLPKVTMTDAGKNNNNNNNEHDNQHIRHSKSTSTSSSSSLLRHRGFAFVTFERQCHAMDAVRPRMTPLLIKNRPVAIDYAVSKHVHVQQQQQQQKQLKQQDHDIDESKKNKDDDDDDDMQDTSSVVVDDTDDDDGSDTESDGSEDAEKERVCVSSSENRKDDDKDDKTDDDDSDSSSTSDDDDDDDDESSNISSEEGNDVLDDNNDRRESLVLPKRAAASPDYHDDAVDDHRSLFVRNLPFDATRHDLFELFAPFGHVQSIHLVKDRITGVAKGTAFCCFRNTKGAQRALEAAGDKGRFVTQRDGVTAAASSASESASGDSSGLFLRGRRLFVDLAVDKKTAASLTVEKQGNKVMGKDRRNIYLKMEGRVAKEADGSSGSNKDAWENLPETDQQKRQRAFAEKNTKLRSPLFFINPKRLSIRNLAKHVDEVMLKKLVVSATRRGLDTKLVSQEDQVAHWRAGGVLTTRDIMNRIEDAKEESGSVIPAFDDGNVKRFIPSVFIDRDFSSNKKEKAPSRGFGFVDFVHHVHALACLRQLNNNPYYSADYVSGGKKVANKSSRKQRKTVDKSVSDDGHLLTPRLIVDFAVENKAKAKKQAEHRAHQLANSEKQRTEQREKRHAEGNEMKKTKKRSRGAIQREKKRKQKETMARDEIQDETNPADEPAPRQSFNIGPDEGDKRKPKVKPQKPPGKKRKIDKEDQDFESLVDSYRKAFSGMSADHGEASGASSMPKKRLKKTERRWFE